MADDPLDRDWRAGSLLRFALPSMAMMLFMGLYTMVDTVFVARFVDTDALSAINIVCPVVNVTVGLGTMLATGGNAIVSRKLGAGAAREARQDFTLVVLTGGMAGLILLLGGLLWTDGIISALGASPRLFPYCKDYLGTLLCFLPACILQTMFANLFVTAGRPGLGLGLSLAAGAANILLDYLFIVPLGMGIRGAALGTGFGYLIPAVAGALYFFRGRGTLFFARPRRDGAVILESCFNGSSEMAGQLASAVTTFLFNRAMMDLLGEDGVAAITILIYAQFLLNTLFLGFSMGIAPIVGFCSGRGDHARLRAVLSAGGGIIAGMSAAVFGFSFLGGPWLIRLFAGQATEVYAIAARGFVIFSFSFLFSGGNLFASAVFTALSKGRLSAVLSFLRTFGLLAGGILLLPRLWGLAGVWLAAPLAEGIMVLVSAACLGRYWRQNLM